MIAIIMIAQRSHSLVVCHVIFLRQCFDVFLVGIQKFLFGKAAYSGIVILHREDLQVVQFAKDAQLAELRDARDEDKAQVGILLLERTEEVTHDISDLVLQFLIIHRVMHRTVVLVDEHHHLLASLLIGSQDHVFHSLSISRRVLYGIINMISPLIFRQNGVKRNMEILQPIILTGAHIYMNHRISLPLLLQLFDGESLEQFLSTLKISLKSRYKKRLSESSRTTQKQVLRIMRQLIYEGCLIYISITTLYYLIKGLYSYRIFHIAHIFSQSYIIFL